MEITAVDQELNLFSIKNLIPQTLEEKILSTPWLELSYTREQYQETWSRRRINSAELPWFAEWEDFMSTQWQTVIVDRFQKQFKKTILPYPGTAFWVDEPGFICPIHTDGLLPGSVHIMWYGKSNLGTTFYHDKNLDSVRYQVEFKPNNGYIMINQPDLSGVQPLLWHAMMNPVPQNDYRVTSYTMINVF